MSRDIEKIALWVVKIGLWMIPFLPLYVSSSMLFPFITGKNFAFRIIVEIIFCVWVGLAVLRPEYRPRLTAIFKAVTIFIGIIFLADLFGPNPLRSFFSNYERMEGFMMLVHLYAYFVMLATLFTRRDWMVIFHTTIIASILVSYVALLQKFGYRISLQWGFRVDSTIGNPTYLAAYLVFHVWLLLMLMYHYAKRWWRVGLYGTILLIELAIIYFTATRGAILALLAVFIPLCGAVIYFWPRIFPRHPYMRRWACGVLAVIIFIPILFWSVRHTQFVQSNPVLQRLTSFSLKEKTFQSRFFIWGMSSRGAFERPILGWGQENYYLVFQKYFNPGLYANEPWFDRSHNIIFDWLIHAGFLGLAAYVAILIATTMGIIRGVRKSSLSLWTGLMLLGMLVTYFFQDLFVFDNLNTYLLFFMFVAYVHASTRSDGGSLVPVSRLDARDVTRGAPSYRRAYRASSIAFVFFLVGLYPLHIAPIKEAQELIGALQIQQVQGSADQVIAAFKRALSYHTFGDAEVREQISNVARSAINDPRFSPDDKKKILDFSLEELRAQTMVAAPDVKHFLFLGALLNTALGIGPQYSIEAEQVLKRAVQLSPTKQLIYFELAQLYLNQGKLDQSIEALRSAVQQDTSYQEAAVNLLMVGFLAKRADVVAEAKTYLHINVMDEATQARLGATYERAGDYVSALEVFEHLIIDASKNPRYHLNIAALSAGLGDTARAKKEAGIAVELDSSVKPQVDEFLKQLESR